MRIVITGVPGTGKTTLCNLIAGNTTLKLIPEIETVVMNKMGFSNANELYQRLGDKGMIDWFSEFLDEKIKLDLSEQNYVADKSLFDCGARWFARMWKGATEEQHEKVREAMSEVSKGVYDKILYLPLHMKRETGEGYGRTQDKNLRYQRGLILQGLFGEYKVPFESYEFSFTDSPEKVIKDLGLEGFKKSKY